MEIKCEKTINYILVLDEFEARWLKALVQNPLYSNIEEDPQNKEMRQNFWDALNKEMM